MNLVDTSDPDKRNWDLRRDGERYTGKKYTGQGTKRKFGNPSSLRSHAGHSAQVLKFGS